MAVSVQLTVFKPVEREKRSFSSSQVMTRLLTNESRSSSRFSSCSGKNDRISAGFA